MADNDLRVKIFKLATNCRRMKSREDILIDDLEKFYNSDLINVKILFATILKRSTKKKKNAVKQADQNPDSTSGAKTPDSTEEAANQDADAESIKKVTEIINTDAVIEKSGADPVTDDTPTDDTSKIIYVSETSKRQMLDFINDLVGLPSLRIHDWFITNYSKKFDTHYHVHVEGNRYKHIFVHRDYKAQLDSYSKKLFDPFCRRSRVYLVDPYGNKLNTTAAQLNFFRWAIENKVIEYVTENIKVIEQDMKVNQNDKYEKKKTPTSKKGARKPRQELSISATKMVAKHNVKIVVSFN